MNILKNMTNPEQFEPDQLKTSQIVFLFFLLVISFVLIVAEKKLPVFTGKSAYSSYLVLGSREKGTRIEIPYYLPVLLQFIIVPIKVVFTALVLWVVSKFNGVKIKFNSFMKIFILFLTWKTIANLLVFLVRWLFNMENFDIAVFNFDVVLLFVFYLVSISLSRDRWQKLFGSYAGIYTLYIILMGILRK